MIDWAKVTTGGVRPFLAPIRRFEGHDVGFAPYSVAARDAPPAVKLSSEFLCDNYPTDDQAIQAAINALPAAGGKVVLSEGTFTCAAQLARAIDNVSIIGSGRGTRINSNGSTAVISAGSQAGWLLRDFSTDAGGVDIDIAPESAAQYWKDGSRVGDTIQTYRLLDQIVAILGTTRLMFYPCLQAHGTDVHIYGVFDTGDLAAHPSDAGGLVALEAEFDPVELAAPGVHAYYFDQAADNHMVAADCNHITHGNGTVDTPVSWGAWIFPTKAIGDKCSIIAKYGDTANQEEYDFCFNGQGRLSLELKDFSVGTKEVATGSSVITPWHWNFIVATYDGAQDAPDVHLYLSDLSGGMVDTNPTGATVETGAYVAMDNSTSDLMIGARDATGTPAYPYNGLLTLPFSCGKELTAAEVSSLYTIGKKLIGL